MKRKRTLLLCLLLGGLLLAAGIGLLPEQEPAAMGGSEKQEGNTVSVTSLTQEEFAERYREITGKEPAVLDEDFAAAEVRYRENELFGAGYPVEVGCLVKLEDGQLYAWDEVVEGTAYSQAAGNGDYVWDESYVHAEVMGEDATKRIELLAGGLVEVAEKRWDRNRIAIGIGAEALEYSHAWENATGVTEYMRNIGSISHTLYARDFT